MAPPLLPNTLGGSSVSASMIASASSARSRTSCGPGLSVTSVLREFPRAS
jgi:hypothetical protein